MLIECGRGMFNESCLEGQCEVASVRSVLSVIVLRDFFMAGGVTLCEA